MAYNALVIVLSTFTCLQFGIFALNSVMSYQISTFKIDRLTAFINSVIPLLPVINYATMLISYDEQHPPIVSFFIEWSVAIPLLLTNAGRLLQFNVYEYATVCLAGVTMTLIGYASAVAKTTETMFALYGVSAALYAFIFLFMLASYCRRRHQRFRETNFPSQLTKNNRAVFKWLFSIIATTWNGYPIAFILWKTDTITIEQAIISFACLDFVSKGLCVLLILSYTLMLHQQNGYLVKAFRRIVKVHPIADTAAAQQLTMALA
jgi:bacteriorhodopsin